MYYNQQQQGFNQNPGGVPYGSAPAHPNINVGAVIQPHIPLITAKLYNDLISRNTQYTQYMATLYSQNGYNNELLAEVIAMVAEYAEYQMSVGNRSFEMVIDEVIQDCNTAVLEHQYRTNPNKIPVPVTQAEAIRQQANRSKMTALRPKINEFKKRRESNNMNQYNQPQHQPGMYPLPQQGGMYPQQQQMTPMQMQEHQRLLMAQQQYQNQLAQQQQYQGQPQYQQQHMGHQQAVQQPGSSPFAQSVMRKMQSAPQAYQPQFGGQQMPPQFQNQAQGFHQPQFNNQPAYQQGYHQPHPNQHPGQFATNSNQMQQMQQQPPTTKMSQSGYDPMPMIDQSQLNVASTLPPKQADRPNDPFEYNSQFMAEKREVNIAPVRTHNEPMGDYEIKIRQLAEQMGLPGRGASLDYLEDAINKMDPANGLVSKRSAYVQVDKTATAVEPAGPYSRDVDLNDESIQVTQVTGDASDNFATHIRDQIAAQSDKQFVRQADGTYITVSRTMAQQFEQDRPGQDIKQADLKAYKAERAAPYPFATMNLKGEWVVPSERYNDIKHKGVFVVPATYLLYSTTGHYIVDDEGKIVDFFSRPVNKKEEDMDINLHDDTRFFTPMTTRDVKNKMDEQSLLDTFAKLQVEQKVEQVIQEIEEMGDVLDVDDDVLVVDKTVIFEEQVNGNVLGDDYYTIAYNRLREETDGIKYKAENLAFRYVHAHMYPWTLKGKDLATAKSMRYKEDYEGILETLNQLSEDDAFPASWFNLLNDTATKYVNNVIKTRYPLDDNETFYIKSFCLDIESAIDEMKLFGYENDFRSTARKLAQTLLYSWLKGNTVYDNYFGEDDDSDSTDGSSASFGILRDITIVPLHSRDIPLYTQKSKCLLTEHGFKPLWEIAKDRVENKNTNVSEIVIVTSDNRHMYINETTTPGIYMLTSKSVIE